MVQKGRWPAVWVTMELMSSYLLHCTLSLVMQCIVIGPVCLFVCGFVCLCVWLWVCYHDNSKLFASIFTKLGL